MDFQRADLLDGQQHVALLRAEDEPRAGDAREQFGARGLLRQLEGRP